MATALTRAHLLAQTRLKQIVSAAVLAHWDGLPRYDDANVEPFVAAVVPIILAAQRHSVALTNAYVARTMGRRPYSLPVDELIGAPLRNGTPPEEVYKRPFVNVWTALNKGVAVDAAIHSGRARLEATAVTDVQHSQFAALPEIGRSEERIIGWERIPNGNACNLCLMASTQRYHYEVEPELHDRCNCTVEAIWGHVDLTRVIHPERLDALKASGKAEELKLQQQAMRARQNDKPDQAKEIAARLKAHRERMKAGDFEKYEVHQHGELGPVLTRAGDHFTTEAEIHAA